VAQFIIAKNLWGDFDQAMHPSASSHQRRDTGNLTMVELTFYPQAPERRRLMPNSANSEWERSATKSEAEVLEVQ